MTTKAVLLATSAWLLSSVGAGAATITPIGDALNSPLSSGGSSVTTMTITTTAAVNAGDMVVVAVGEAIGSIVPTVTDSLGQSYSCTAKFNINANGASGAFCYRPNSGAMASGSSITLTVTTANAALGLAAADVTGVNSLDVLGTSQVGTSATAAAISPAPSITPGTSSAEPLLALYLASSSNTASLTEDATDGWTTIDSPGSANANLRFFFSGQVVSSTSPVTWAPKVSVSGRSYGAQIVAFRNVTSSGGCRHTLTMTGIGC